MCIQINDFNLKASSQAAVSRKIFNGFYLIQLKQGPS